MIKKFDLHDFLENPYNMIVLTMVYIFIFGLFSQPIDDILQGLLAIIQAPDVLVTDYLYIGGFGAAMINSSITMFIAFMMLKAVKHEFTSGTISNLWLVAGFSFFGKNPLNVIPIWIGGWLYSKYMNQNFNQTILVTIVATSLGPVVTVPFNLYQQGIFENLMMSLTMSVSLGVFIGFIFEPVASNVLKVHEGFNLYNGGLAAGIIAITLSSVYESFGIQIDPVDLISYDYHREIIFFITILAVFYMMVGLYLNPNWRKTIRSLLKINETKSDYYPRFGTVVYLNMGMLALVALLTIESINFFAPGTMILHGPALGGMLSSSGFGANGKNAPSSVSIYIGVLLAASVSPIFTWSDPGILTTMLFAVCLCPIPTRFGWWWGIPCGFFTLHFATSLAGPAGGMNLYNNGLAAGFVAILLYPLLLAIERRKEERHQRDRFNDKWY